MPLSSDPLSPSPSSPESLRYPTDILPKTEHHLHIEGAISLEEYRSVVSVDADWVPPAWAPDYRYPTFKEFEDFILGYADSWFSSPERYHTSATSLFRQKMAEGIRYLECSFGVIVCEMKGLPVNEVVDAIHRAIPAGLEVRIFMGIHHDSWKPQTRKLLTDALELKNLDGIDLHGPERYPIRDWLPDYWSAARAVGKFTKAHAGELGAAWHVREAVEKLGVRRVEHGLRAIEDPAVVQLLVDNGVVLDVCPISNVKLQTVSSYAAHPIRELIEAGVKCTLNTDDPFIFGNTINDDYAALGTEGGLPLQTLIQLARNGFEEALVTPDVRQRLLAEFDTKATSLLSE